MLLKIILVMIKKLTLWVSLGVGLMMPTKNFAQAFQDSYEETVKEMQNIQYAPSEESDVQLRVLNMDGPVRPEWNEETRKFIFHRIKQSTWTSDIIGRSIMYAPFIEKVLIENELPIELSYLCLVESQFNTRTVSHAGAAGLWQLMPETARLMGLKVNHLIDERFDPYKSTEAAVKYLKYLYSMFNDWGLAIAGYNMGPYRINQLIKEGKGTTYWELRQYLPKETQSYVPAYIASSYLMQFYPWHNIKPTLPNLDLQLTTSIKVTEYLTFATIAQLTELPLTTLETLNPAYRKNYLPENIDGNYLILPRRVAGNVENYLATPKEARPDLSNRPILTTNSVNPNTYYEKVKITIGTNDNLVNLSKAFNCSASNIRAWNSLSSFYVADGQQIRIFQPRTSFSEIPSAATYANTTPIATPEMIAAQEEILKQERAKAISKTYAFVEWVGNSIPADESNRLEVKPNALTSLASVEEPPSEKLTERTDLPQILLDEFEEDNTATTAVVATVVPTVLTVNNDALVSVEKINTTVQNEIMTNVVADTKSIEKADVISEEQTTIVAVASDASIENKIAEKIDEKVIVATVVATTEVVSSPVAAVVEVVKTEGDSKVTLLNSIANSEKAAEIPVSETTVASTTAADMATIAAIEDQKTTLSRVEPNVEVTDIQPIKDTFAFTPAVVQEVPAPKPTLAIDGFESPMVVGSANVSIQTDTTDQLANYIYHFIGRNETLVDIAEKYENVCVSDILALNKLSQNTTLAVGAKIKVKAF
jgi:membrane-bound lytic murein transglycosylase D